MVYEYLGQPYLVTRQYLGLISISMLLAVLYLSKLNYTTVKNRCGHYIKFYMFIEIILNESKISLQNMKLNIKDGDYIFIIK